MKKLVIAGIDEVGRGCLAGPVVSAAAVVKESIDLKLLKTPRKFHSKKDGRSQNI